MNVKDYINFYTIAGAAAGGYVGHAKYGKKHGYTAPIVGALGGIAAGLIVQRLIGGQPAAAPQVTAAQAQPQVTAQTQPQGEYVDLDGMGGYVPPPPPNANPTQRAEYEAAQAAFEDLGSLSGNSGDGLGSLGSSRGFDADAIDYDELMGEDGGSDFN